MTLFIGCVVGEFAIGSVAAIVDGNFLEFMSVCWFFAFFLAFLLGTYSRVNLARNTKGQIKLTKTWRAFFYELPTTQLKLSQYEGIATGHMHYITWLDWFLLLLLLVCFFVPGLIWFYLSFFRVTFFVALAKDHGSPDYFLYRGFNEELMKEMS